MLERTIELKRNSFFVFVLKFLPIIFWGGVISIWAYDAFSSDVSKWLSCLFFVTALVFALIDLKNNRRFIKISKSGISACHYSKGKLIVEKFLEASEIMFIKCNERSKKIYVTLKDATRYELLKYNSAHMLGADKLFLVKAELCRFFPSLAHEFIDDEVKLYIESESLSEFLKSKVEKGKNTAVILFVVELIFSAIPLGLGLIALTWVVVRMVYYILLGVVFVLDKFSM